MKKFAVQLDWVSIGLMALGISLYLFLGLTSQYQAVAGYILGLALAGIVMMMVTGGLPTAQNYTATSEKGVVRDFVLAFGAIYLSNGLVSALPTTFIAVTGNPAVILGVLIAIAEELWFRGFLAPYFANRVGLWPGLVSQAVLFTVYHTFVYGNNPSALIIVFLSGLILGYVDLKSGRILPSMGAHLLVNAIAFGLI